MEPKPYGIIYLLIDATCDKEYVGQTTRSLEYRFYQHKYGNQYVDHMIRDHGEMFVKIILKVCYSRKELDYWEKHFIKYRNTITPNGYNFTDGGEGSKHCDATRAKLSAINTGRKRTEAMRLNLSIKKRSRSSYKNLVAEMDKHHLSYSVLSKLLGLSLCTFSDKMRNKYNFTAEQIAKLVEIFDKPAEYLLKRDDGKEISRAKQYETPFKNLLAAMFERNLSYASLANLLGLSRPVFSKKMLDKQNFSAEQIAKLVEIFDKPAEYLMAREEN